MPSSRLRSSFSQDPARAAALDAAQRWVSDQSEVPWRWKTHQEKSYLRQLQDHPQWFADAALLALVCLGGNAWRDVLRHTPKNNWLSPKDSVRAPLWNSAHAAFLDTSDLLDIMKAGVSVHGCAPAIYMLLSSIDKTASACGQAMMLDPVTDHGAIHEKVFEAAKSHGCTSAKVWSAIRLSALDHSTALALVRSALLSDINLSSMFTRWSIDMPARAADIALQTTSYISVSDTPYTNLSTVMQIHTQDALNQLSALYASLTPEQASPICLQLLDKGVPLPPTLKALHDHQALAESLSETPRSGSRPTSKM